MIKIKRIYEPPNKDDGVRILVDRLWPRSIKKDDSKLHKWLKEIGPSNELRKWFNHDPQKWQKFKIRYFKELKSKTILIQYLESISSRSDLTLVYSAKDELHNQAVVIKDYLLGKK
ncbi:MAG: DUF488 domain-containing protein [Ignavibacteria bacterium]